jgi:hypothetical protein
MSAILKAALFVYVLVWMVASEWMMDVHILLWELIVR